MLNLKDISLYYSNIYISAYIKNRINLEKVISNLIAKGITNYQQLQDYISNCTDEVELEKILLILKDVEIKKESYNKKGKDFKLYQFPKQENINLIKTDLANNCSYLILTNPMMERPLQYLELNKQSINFAKDAISHVDLSGKNVLHNIIMLGDSDIDKIYSAINFYDEQVIRQYEENQDRDVDNIFLLNQKEKKNIVLSQYEDIVEYLLNKSKDNTFVWGELTPRKQRLMEQTIKSQSKDSLKRKEHLVNIITNYTTLIELQEGIVKTKTIDRFIVK